MKSLARPTADSHRSLGRAFGAEEHAPVVRTEGLGSPEQSSGSNNVRKLGWPASIPSNRLATSSAATTGLDAGSNPGRLGPVTPLRIGGTAPAPGDALRCPEQECPERGVQTAVETPTFPAHGIEMVAIKSGQTSR